MLLLSSYPWCCVNPLNKATNLFPSDCCSSSFLCICSPQSTTIHSPHFLKITEILFLILRVCSEHIQYIQGFSYVNTDTYLLLTKFVVECIFINFHIRCRSRVWGFDGAPEQVKHKESATQYSLRAMLHFKLTFTDGMQSTWYGGAFILLPVIPTRLDRWKRKVKKLL